MKKKITNPGVIMNFDVVAKLDSCLARDGQWQEARYGWEDYVQRKDDFILWHFSKDRLQHLDRDILVELFEDYLWAQRRVPRSKETIVDEMLELGLGKIRLGFENLLYSDRPIPERFDGAVSELHGLGAASISEILAHHDKHDYAIWNGLALEGLRFLQVPDKYLPHRNPIIGQDYAEYCRIAKVLISQISKRFPHYNDLLQLDFILYFTSLRLGDHPGHYPYLDLR
jgi:hypothetical protein